MLFKECFGMAVNALLANKLRSLLTMLGIIIGVGAVIAMVSIGMGVRTSVADSFASLGSNMLIVMPGSANTGGVRGKAGSRKSLKYDDAKHGEEGAELVREQGVQCHAEAFLKQHPSPLPSPHHA